MTTCLLAAASLAAQNMPARFPENARDSEFIRDEQYRQMDRYFDRQIDGAAAAREKYWSRLDFSSPRDFDRSAGPYRKDWARYLGVPEAGGAPLNVKRSKVREFDTYTAWRVWFDTVPGVQAYGILLIPKTPSGPKPALICVHGHQGTPEIVAGFLPEGGSLAGSGGRLGRRRLGGKQKHAETRQNRRSGGTHWFDYSCAVNQRPRWTDMPAGLSVGSRAQRARASRPLRTRLAKWSRHSFRPARV
jgi:hypothetical protein